MTILYGSSWNRVGDFEVENFTKLGIARDICIFAGFEFGMTDGWHEHRNVDGGFGIRIRFLVFDRNRQCAESSVIRKHA